MDRKGDLDAALSFVIGRVKEQATLSGERLNEEQRLLLNNLPSLPVRYLVPGPRSSAVCSERYSLQAALCARKSRVPQ